MSEARNKHVPARGLPNLEQLGGGLREIADVLQAHAAREMLRNHRPIHQVSISAPCVHTILFIRRRRKDFLGIETGGAGWEILLTVLAARLDGRLLSPAELGDACGMSRHALGRRLQKLEEEKFLARIEPADPGSPARIDLTEAAANRLCSYLDAALQISPWLL